jgi:short subunit dehydrogenase-like uncharacterized protein
MAKASRTRTGLKQSGKRTSKRQLRRSPPHRQHRRNRMTIDSKDYRVPPDKKIDLDKWPTVVHPYAKSKKQYKQLLQEHMEKLSSLQQLHYASTVCACC